MPGGRPRKNAKTFAATQARWKIKLDIAKKLPARDAHEHVTCNAPSPPPSVSPLPMPVPSVSSQEYRECIALLDVSRVCELFVAYDAMCDARAPVPTMPHDWVLDPRL